MWKLKIAGGEENPWLRTTNNHVGRQVWEFDPELGTPEEIAEVERAREEFRKNRFHMKNSRDSLMKMQFAKENPIEIINLPQIKLGEKDLITEEILSNSLGRALRRFGTFQAHDGHWPADFGAPMFLMPGLIITLYVTGALSSVLGWEHQREILRFIYNHQNEDGGWGFHIEGHSTMFGSVSSYVVLRLLGEEDEDGDGAVRKGREWILNHRGATYTTQWGKFWLSVLGVFDWAGNNPLLPEMMLLPEFLPFHPGRMWALACTTYMPMAYIYGKRFVGRMTPVVASLREELFPIPYEQINWNLARNHCAEEDLYVRHPLIQDILWATLQKIEHFFLQWPCDKLREKALRIVMEHIHYEDEASQYICVGPVNKTLNMLCCWVENQNSEAFKLHLPRVYDYLWIAEDGMKMQAYNGTQMWDTAFSIQAILSSKISEEHGPTLRKAHDFIKQTQILEDSPGNLNSWYRHISKGAWPFSTADNGYPVSDCTAEGLKVALLLSKISPEIVGEKTEEKRIYDAVNVILSFMNENGGFGSYGRQKTYSWLELFNPSETFENIIVDHQCVECTSSAIQALATFKKLYPVHRRNEVDKCITKASSYIEKMQRSDGSWYGTWGICFTYGTWFGVCGLVAAGQTYESSPCIRKACDFLLSKQQPSGGWGESYLSYQNKAYTNLRGGRPHAVNTAWAMLALLEAGQVEVNPKPLQRAAKVLVNVQMDNGEFPQQEIMGASTGNITMGYAAYRNIFPIWALGEYHARLTRT
ncbi:Cycloartenol synthase [Platanthera zijinensis]|uniref:Terpene cyclase/mutase family member n=1 Tax=Platanthera zijinensis TaxID=2320716 RepID=A0AAP0G449_9ASPA